MQEYIKGIEKHSPQRRRERRGQEVNIKFSHGSKRLMIEKKQKKFATKARRHEEKENIEYRTGNFES